MEDSYFTIVGPSEGLYKEKGSKFLAFAWPVKTEEEANERLAELRKRFYDARHVCYAWRLGPTGKHFRSNDDGEPSHSAGDPILNEMKSQEVTDLVIGVVRYFGGTKLGVGGLIRAYGTAAGEALEANERKEVVMTERFRIRFPYERTSEVKKALHPFRLEPTESHYAADCSFVYDIRKSIAENVRVVFDELGILEENQEK